MEGMRRRGPKKRLRGKMPIPNFECDVVDSGACAAAWATDDYGVALCPNHQQKNYQTLTRTQPFSRSISTSLPLAPSTQRPRRSLWLALLMVSGGNDNG